MQQMTTHEIETAIAKKLDTRRNAIIPNVSWSLFAYELDLLAVSPSRWATEIEIKTSLADLRRDKLKRHGHRNKSIKRLYFAIPHYLKGHVDEIPERAGVFVVDEHRRVSILREPQINKEAVKLTNEQMETLARVSAMRIWNLKNTVTNLVSNLKYLREKA